MSEKKLLMPDIWSLPSVCAASAGWRRNLLAFALGICATLTLAPFYIFPLLIPAFTGLYLLIAAAPSRRRVFWDGWWWGWGFYISGLYWLCIALLTDPKHFAWLIPFALFGVTGVIAVYSGLACWIATWLTLPFPFTGEGRFSPAIPAARGGRGEGYAWRNTFIFATVWTLAAYARGHLFTGFPWNLIGYSFGFSDASLQLASLVGVYGLTWFAVLLGASFATIAGFRIQDSGFRKGIICIAVVWSLFAAGIIWGIWRLHAADQVPESERYVPNVMLRLVQADVTQLRKWDPALRMEGVRRHVRLTESPGLNKITHIIWPETAVPFALEQGSPLAQALGAAIPEGKILITGTLRVEGEEQHFQIWNSLVALDHRGNIIGSYDKTRLVPFGEFLPFRSLIPSAWLTPVGSEDFSRGRGAETVTWPGLPPLSPLICYEAIFPETVVDAARRPQWLLNVTNDAWFGQSSGPYQHFEMARMRAVEQGMPLVRAANTGISAVVDSYGRVLAELPLGTEGILDHKLPKAQPVPTAYSRYSNRIILSLLFVPLLLILGQQKRKED